MSDQNKELDEELARFLEEVDEDTGELFDKNVPPGQMIFFMNGKIYLNNGKVLVGNRKLAKINEEERMEINKRLEFRKKTHQKSSLDKILERERFLETMNGVWEYDF